MYWLWLKRNGVGAGEQSAPFGARMTRRVYRAYVWKTSSITSSFTLTQYLSVMNFLPLSDARSSYAPFIERSGSLAFWRGTFL